MEKLKLQFYPYTFARVSVMKAKLIPRHEYDKLVKMELNGITLYLENTEYKSEIDRLTLEYSGVQLLEVALYKNLTRTFNKLKRISNEGTRRLIEEYLKRMDIWNIKTLIRGKYTKMDDDQIRNFLIPVGVLTEEKLEQLLEMDTISEIIDNLKIFEEKYFKQGYEYFEQTNSLVLLENQIDIAYYKEILEFIKTIPKQGKLFSEFLGMEIDFLNIRNLVKLKLAGFEEDKIRQFIFFSGRYIPKNQLEDLIGAKDLKRLMEKLKKTEYGAILKESIAHFEETGELSELDLVIENYLLKKADFLPHAALLSVNNILGYMFAKELEIKNLQKIIKSKQLGMSEEFIRKQIVAG